MNTDIHICTADLGAGQPGAGLGPHAVLTAAAQRGLALVPDTVIDGPQRWGHLNRPSIEVLDTLIETGQAQCRAVAESLRAGRRVLALSGDHANAVGWLSGVREAFPHGRVGVVWIDAHGDLHTPGTSPSGNVHGMPLGALLGCNDARTDFRTLRAWRQWQRLGNPHLWPKLDPRDLALVEIRDLEDAEWTRIDDMRIDNHAPTHREVWGIDHVIDQLRARFAYHDALFVSFDVDALDAPLVPGTGTPVEGGLSLDDARRLLTALVEMPNFVGLEVAEVNPLLDVGNTVANSVADLLQSAWPALSAPRPEVRHAYA